MDNLSSTQPSGPEKPADARFSPPAQPANGPPAHQQQQQLFELPKSEPFRTTKPFAVAKLVLGSLNLVFAIVALGLSVGLLVNSFSYGSFIGIVICLALAIASIIWQLAEHVTLCVRRALRPIHPGAHVGVHLVLSVLAFLVVFFLFLTLAWELPEYTIESDCVRDTYDSSYPYGSYSDWCSYNSFPTQADADKYFRLLEALAAFSLLLFIAHFSLFVMACVETDRRRKWGKANRVVYLVAAPGPVDGRTYYTPVAAQAFANHRGSVLAPQPVHHNQQQQGNADPGVHGYYAPPAGVPPGTAA